MWIIFLDPVRPSVVIVFVGSQISNPRSHFTLFFLSRRPDSSYLPGTWTHVFFFQSLYKEIVKGKFRSFLLSRFIRFFSPVLYHPTIISSNTLSLSRASISLSHFYPFLRKITYQLSCIRKDPSTKLGLKLTQDTSLLRSVQSRFFFLKPSVDELFVNNLVDDTRSVIRSETPMSLLIIWEPLNEC